MTAGTICLVTPGRLSCNPRVVKEADALHEAGYRVAVVCGPLGPLGEEEEHALLADRPWAGGVTRIHPQGLQWTMERAVTRFCRSLTAAASPLRPALAAQRHSALIARLRRAVEDTPADMYIAHYMAGLAAAGPVANRKNAILGFDAEDAHHLELTPTDAERRAELAARDAIQRRWLPRCAHLTCAAPLIAESYAERYGVRMTPVLNVFPLDSAPKGQDAPPEDVCLYWFSQKLGPGRGIEELLEILGKLPFPVSLHLRGVAAPAYRGTLESLAGATRLEFMPPVPPGRLPSSASIHTAGLCVELPDPPHHDICLANKIFTYLLAGIPSILSATRAHRCIAEELEGAACVIDLADPAASAEVLAAYLGNGKALQSARKAAARLARTRFNWDREKEVFLQSVDRALMDGSGPE